MSERISGINFAIDLDGLRVRVQKVTLDITDNSTTASDQGIPNGWVRGDVSASGEMELDAANLKVMIEAADRAGSFRDIDDFDITFFAKTGSNEMKVQAFGCRLKLSGLLDIDPTSNDKHTSTVQFDVTSPDFIRINGIPYLSQDDTEGMLS